MDKHYLYIVSAMTGVDAIHTEMETAITNALDIINDCYEIGYYDDADFIKQRRYDGKKLRLDLNLKSGSLDEIPEFVEISKWQPGSFYLGEHFDEKEHAEFDKMVEDAIRDFNKYLESRKKDDFYGEILEANEVEDDE